MNTREAMQALLAGKKLRARHWRESEHICLCPEGRLQHSKWGYAILLEPGEYFLYEEPNPYTKGTFAWAIEQSNRGYEIGRPNQGWWMPAGVSDPKQRWRASDALATDWSSR
jgi:hypothetical protein